jgi:hypothetical protein
MSRKICGTEFFGLKIGLGFAVDLALCGVGPSTLFGWRLPSLRMTTLANNSEGTAANLRRRSALFESEMIC